MRYPFSFFIKKRLKYLQEIKKLLIFAHAYDK